MDWRTMALVALGSALGGALRFALSGWLTRGAWPVGTLAVNVAGCFLIGLLFVGAAGQGQPVSGTRVFVAVGLLGGFTTMSAFSLETVAFAAERQHGTAAAYVGATLASCLAGTWLGSVVAAALWGEAA